MWWVPDLSTLNGHRNADKLVRTDPRDRLIRLHIKGVLDSLPDAGLAVTPPSDEQMRLGHSCGSC
jgi:hypothetical protein